VQIDKEAIQRLIPHSGAMCLLDGVTFWDASTIECVSMTHLARDNPLRVDGRLLGVHLIEYGAQAIAVHGGLLVPAKNRSLKPGYLAAISEAHFYVDTLDAVSSELNVVATSLVRSDAGVVYTIEVSSREPGMLAEARATVVFIGAAPQ
jgi:predicted hotdog family 3-hydroxylacyl-ACP dehydratase